MAVKFQHQSLIPTSSSNVHPPQKAIGINFFYKEVVHLNQLLCRGISKQRWHLRYGLSDCEKHIISCRWLESRKCRTPYHKPKRLVHSTPLSSTDDGVTVNGSPQASSSSDVEEMRLKLDQSLQGEDLSTALVQSLHDAARSTEMAIKEHISSFAISWFSKTWLGVDKNAWVKTLSYQAAVHSLLQAAVEISSRGNGRDRDINVFVQRSLTRQSAPLEIVIRDELTAKQPTTNEWFWSEQHPMVVTTFVNLFERDPRFTAATTVCWKGVPSGSCSASDLQLLMLALSCIAAVTKIGLAKVSCSHFFSMVPDTTGRLMDMLIDFVPIGLAYSSIKDIGLRREFLLHFGPRAAACRVKNDQGIEEMSFWVDLVQKQLQRAIDRERIWSRLTTCESIEVLEKDLAIFGFFIALGRSTQSFLSANGFTVMDEPVEGIIRYLIGGSVLYYPQLSSISSYQLYVEVVCEELEWLPFYIFDSVDIKQLQGNKGQGGVPLGEAVSQVLDTCSHWMKSFIKYSAWLENPSNIKAARFLSRGHSKLKACRQDMGVVKNQIADNVESRGGRTESGSEVHSPAGRELDSFDKALESVEEALNRLEELLQELHLSNSNNGKEHLKAACSDLERIRKLKKEAEFLEASFRAKSASLEQGDDRPAQSQKETSKGKSGGSNKSEVDRSPAERLKIMKVVSRPHGLWSFLVRQSSRKTEPGLSTANPNEYELSEQFTSSSMGDEESESNEIRRFELLRRELIELEKRVQRSTDGTQNDEVCNTLDSKDKYVAAMSGNTLVHVQKKESIIAKSIDKLKEASTDVWQGTQLLAIDVGAAVVLLKRVLTGDELTQKEKKALRRTLTDLASVVPIGFLMLLPVTAVGHAAMLAAIQRYVPSLIPSTYAPERLYLLRQLEKVKEMESGEINPDETAGASGLSRSSTESS